MDTPRELPLSRKYFKYFPLLKRFFWAPTPIPLSFECSSVSRKEFNNEKLLQKFQAEKMVFDFKIYLYPLILCWCVWMCPLFKHAKEFHVWLSQKYLKYDTKRYFGDLDMRILYPPHWTTGANGWNAWVEVLIRRCPVSPASTASIRIWYEMVCLFKWFCNGTHYDKFVNGSKTDQRMVSLKTPEIARSSFILFYYYCYFFIYCVCPFV